MNIFQKIIKCQDGATAIEYGLIATLLGVAIITSLSTLQNSILNTMLYSKSTLNSAGNGKL
jgi:pilus assembly protein Flp/PilA